MAQAQDLREAIAAVADRPGPVFSGYVSVNAAIPENQERAYLVRMRDAMNERTDILRNEFGGIAGLTRF
jgi:hypothetical protein